MHSQCSVASTQILWMYCTPSCYEISHRLNSIIAENCVTAVINTWYLFHPWYRFPSKQLLWGLISSCSLFFLHFLLSPKLVGYLKTVPHLHFLSCLKAPRVIDGNALCLLCVWEHRITWTMMSELQVFPGQAPFHVASSWTGSLMYLMEAGAIRLFQ